MTPRHRRGESDRPLKPIELTGRTLIQLRKATGWTRAAVARRAGINHATLRLAELTPDLVRLTPSNAQRMLQAYEGLGLQPRTSAGPHAEVNNRSVTIALILPDLEP